MKNFRPVLIRILIGLLFVFSGSVKLFPAIAFEMQLVMHGITNWLLVVILARFIITVEIFTGLMFLLNYNLKRFFLPFAILLLSLFSLDLVITVSLRGFSGDCGCFGQVIRMTPLEALAKNIVLVFLLFYYGRLKTSEKQQSLQVPAAAFIIVFIAVFAASPVQYYKIGYQGFTPEKEIHAEVRSNISQPGYAEKNPLQKDAAENMRSGNNSLIRNTQPKEEVQTEKIEYLKEFISSPVIFSGEQKVLLNKGEKIIAVLNMECGSCLDAARRLAGLKSETGFSEIYLLLYGTQQEVPAFFKKVNFNFDYKIIDDKTFFSLISGSPPAVFLLKEGGLAGFWNYRTFNLDSVKKKLSKKIIR